MVCSSREPPRVGERGRLGCHGLTANAEDVTDLKNTVIAIDGTSAVVGCSQDDDNGGTSGSAYVYDYDGTTWNESKIHPLGGSSLEWFGYAVDIDGTTIIGGAFQGS